MSHSNMVLSRLTDTCAEEGQVNRALAISLDIEELVHSTNHLLQAAATLNRSVRKEQDGAQE
jgi:hypothetical protein